ncbi:hypothetical protein [Opitutus terrae]|uniref:Uncharacterized protein n=1 Tax=Opitutus terrae (strain DSM 11246 / JCM 15787 / PB90-1) TaxID=452637 RepID=B1ZN34_OPITP|nr:hypothetical protein [Opitutus terrae]ACB76486.1 hypothetical protein Oter_3206 [Opitutus terrae PB90-1]
MEKPLISLLHGIVIVGLISAGPYLYAGPNQQVVIRAQVFNGYARTKLANGTFKPERFALARGTHWKNRKLDKSIDALEFPSIARTIAGPLIQQQYLPSADPQQTELLILVSWGTTTGSAEGDYDHAQSAVFEAMNVMSAAKRTNTQPAAGTMEALTAALSMQEMENRLRDRNNVQNAEILGYTEAFGQAQHLREFGFGTPGDATYWELEANRYFVVLKAYDFPLLKNEKKRKLLWEARFSIYEQGNRFAEQLPAMTQAAARFFGRDSGGLVHRADLPQTKIEYGEPIIIETVESPRSDAGR